jgi:hypothetical protein
VIVSRFQEAFLSTGERDGGRDVEEEEDKTVLFVSSAASENTTVQENVG